MSSVLERRPTSGHRRTALAAICVGFALIQLDATIVNVALPAIQRDLGGTIGALQWIIDSYTLALAALMLTTGSIADQWGARRVYIVGLLVFTGASAACFAAPTLGILLAARAVQGIGAATLLPCSLALLAHIFPAGRERTHALSVWGGVASVGLAAGPVAGGLLTAGVGWRLIFLVNVPIGLATAVLLRWAVPQIPGNANRRVDLAGMVCGAGALTGVAAGCINAGEYGWISAPAIVPLLVGAAMTALFIVVEHRSPRPMMPLSVFATASFRATVMLGFFFNLCLYGALLCLTLFLQQVRGLGVLPAGLALLPLTVSIGVGASASGRMVTRFGPRTPMLLGMLLAGAGALVLSLVGRGTPLTVLIAGSLLLGMCSLCMPAMTSVALNALGTDRAGLASGILNAARQTGGAVGVAFLGAWLTADQLSLQGPLLVTALCYGAAALLAWRATAVKSV
jgi:DHA2 family methylenomycin A resistance protein-like MFS transporter